MPTKSGVFISYARSDGSEDAAWLRKKLEDEHISLWQDLISERSGRDWWLQITEALDNVAYMIVVATPDCVQSANVLKEWRYARQQGVCVLPVQSSKNINFASLPHWMRMKQFANLHVKEQWDLFLSDLRRPCETPRVPSMAEDLPSNFVPRPELAKPLIAMLLDESRERQKHPDAITTALRGGGGFGKTMLAKAICHDDRVQEVYDDGILWVTLGESVGEERLKGKITDLVRVLTGQHAEFDTKEAAGTRLRELLDDRDILMVIDDVWNPADLHTFLQGGRRCARLITTRNLDTLPQECRDVKVDSMEANEAVQLLGTGLPSDGRRQIGELADRLGKWPLLLGIVNGTVRERVEKMNQSLGDALTWVSKALARRGLTAFESANAGERERAVQLTMAVSLELFSETERERFQELAIFHEDVNVPLQVVLRLWQATGHFDEFDTEDLCVRLQRHSLLQTLDLATREVRLHGVMRTYLQTALARRPDPRLVHGKLVDAWGDPHKLPDSYAWRWYAYHLSEAGRQADLRALLLSPEWLQAKLGATDVTSLTADFDYQPEDEDLRLVQGAIRLSSNAIARDPGQFASQMVGRLLLHQYVPIIAKFTDRVAENIRSPWLRLLQPTLHPPGTALVRVLEGHNRNVIAVAVTPDGQHAVSASRDQTLKVWDLESGRELRTLTGHTDSVRAVAVTPDGRRAVSASADKTLKVWELESGRELGTLTGHAGGVYTVAVTADGQRAVSASSDQTLKVWDLGTGRELRTLHGHTDVVNAVAVTPDGHYTVSASSDRTLRVWDMGIGRELRTLHSHTDVVNAVAVTPDGQYAVSASSDQTLKVWELASGRELAPLTGHSDLINAVAMTPDGQCAVSASRDQTLMVWKLGSGRDLQTHIFHSESVNAVAVTPDGQRAVSASDDHTLKIWELGSGRKLRTLTGHANWVNAVAVMPDGQRVVSASGDQTLKVWELDSGRELCTLKGHTDWVHAVAVMPDGQRVVSASRDKTLKVWDLDSKRELRTLTGHRDSIWAVALTSDGQRAVSASVDQTLKVWELGSGRELGTLTGHAGDVYAVAVTPDGQRAVSASVDQTLKVWDLGSRRELRTLTGHTGSVYAVAVTPDGQYAVSGSRDRTLRMWKLETGLLVAIFTCQTPVHSCAFVDGRTIVAGDDGGQIHFLKLENAD